MSSELFISEIMFAIIGTIAAVISWEFYKTKNGALRKLMIAYFAIVAFVYYASGLYFWAYESKLIDWGINTLRLIVLTPKALVMIGIYIYLVKRK